MQQLGEVSRQTVVLYAAQLLSLGLSLAFYAIVGRAMSQEDYGVFTFCVFSIIVFVGYLFEFGLFSAGQRLLAIAGSLTEERRVLGALCASALAVGVLFAIVIAALGPVIDVTLARFHPGEVPIARALLVAAPFAMAIPFQFLVETACQGANRIAVLAGFRLAVPIASLVIVESLLLTGVVLTPLPAILAYLGGILVSSVLVLAFMRPSLDVGAGDLRLVAAAVREYGFDIYAGRIVGMMSLRLDQILIPFYVGTRRWGAYKIAQQMSDPISNLARTLATTRFKAFANAREVDRSLVRWNIALLAAAAAGLAGVGPFVFVLIFPNKFRNALPLFLPFALSAFFAGLLQPYNVFLTARGSGKALRNVSLAVGGANVIGVPLFAYRYGLLGAAWYAVFSMSFNFALHLYYYRKLQKTLDLQAEPAMERAAEQTER